MMGNGWPVHICALLLGFILDIWVGDPEWFPHPVRFIGRLIARLEAVLRSRFKNLRRAAVVLTSATVLLTMGITALLLGLLRWVHPIAYFAGMVLLSWLCLSARNLAQEAAGVAHALETGLEDGRKRVSRIVGRDTAALSEEDILKATIETVAENTTDGIVSPMIYLALGGPVLALGFKAASTLDSMVGYRNEKYEDLGWSSARLDDLLNFIPARITAMLMCLAAWAAGLDGKNALRIVRRDHANHKSPNCAWSEAAAAGAMHIQLGGTHQYFGETVEKPTIGDADRAPTVSDIASANRLMWFTSIFAALAVSALGWLAYAL